MYWGFLLPKKAHTCPFSCFQKKQLIYATRGRYSLLLPESTILRPSVRQINPKSRSLSCLSWSYLNNLERGRGHDCRNNNSRYQRIVSINYWRGGYLLTNNNMSLTQCNAGGIELIDVTLTLTHTHTRTLTHVQGTQRQE